MYYQIGFNDNFTELTQRESNNLDIDKNRIINALKHDNREVVKAIISKYSYEYRVNLIKSLCNKLNNEDFSLLYLIHESIRLKE